MTAPISKMSINDLKKLAQKGKQEAKGRSGGREFTKLATGAKKNLAAITKVFDDTVKKNPEV